MRLNLPCTCDAEEHELDVEPEWYCGRLGYHGPGEGDPLPCGRLITKADVDEIYDRIIDAGSQDP